MKITKDCIFWRKWKFETPEQEAKAKEYSKGEPFEEYECYFAWWNLLTKKHRYWGHDFLYYDCRVHEHFGFWFFNISWSTTRSFPKYKKQYPNEFQ